MATLSQKIVHAAYRGALYMSQAGRYQALLRAAADPSAAQSAVLARILSANAETEFGKRHDFARLQTIDDYRRAVPVQSYEDLRPFIERQEVSGEPCLTREPPVYYHRTSGTLGAPKNIPVTQSGLQRIRRRQRLFSYVVSRGTDALEGKIFGITGQAVEGRMAGGTPYGSASGLLARSQSRFVHGRYALPAAVADIPDYEARYLAMAVYALAEPFVTGLGTANPSTLVRLLSVINRETDVILRAIAGGDMPSALARITPELGAPKPAPKRAAHLAGVLRERGTLSYADIWPDLKAVMTWTGGSCGVPLRRLAAGLPDRARVVELGYMASEVQGTINSDAETNACLPLLTDTLFEFVERASWESGDHAFLSLHELEPGGEYYVFVTTAEGLYRYDMNDIVRVTRLVDQTPALEFVQKGKGVTNITGEKLYEAQILDAVQHVVSDAAIDTSFFLVLADQETAKYTLYIEGDGTTAACDNHLAEAIDVRLRSLNVEYDGKRASGRLAHLAVSRLQPGTGDAYRVSRVAAGQRDAQFKYLHLQYAHECGFDFDDHVARA